MPPHVVARKNSVSSRLPDALQLGATLLAGIDFLRILENVQSWLPLSRRGGHGIRGIFAFAVVFLLAGPSWGIKRFSLIFSRELRRLVAPLVALCALPTATSMSRALGALEHGPVRACLDKLLVADTDMCSALTSPHILHRDAHGHGWHLLDLDPTIEGFRQRSLPGGPTMPEPVRLAPGTPGYTGHKRGELRVRHLPVQHAGLGAWLAYRLDATGASLLPLVGEVVRVSKSTIINRNADAKIILRADGEFGSVGAMRTIMAEGVDLLTRLSRYGLLDREDVVAHMQGMTWYNLISSGAGPERQAADLGLFMLHPDDAAAASKDGPVEVRVVVTRFARSGYTDHGILKDGYQLELFATTLSSDAWPPESVASLYFGRAVIENSFAAEDREFGIDRTFSYHPPGQEWMSGVALFLWNVMIGKGIATNPLPATVDAQERQTMVRPEPPPEVIVQPPPIPILPEENVEAEEKVEAEVKVESPSAPEPPIEREIQLASELWQITHHAFGNLVELPGWRLDAEKQEIRCANGKRLHPFSTERHHREGKRISRTRYRLWIRTQTGACAGCPYLEICRETGRPNVPKQLAREISLEEWTKASEILKELRRLRKLKKNGIKIVRRWEKAAPSAGTPAPAPRRPALPPLGSLPVGNLVPDSPLFKPSASRKAARKLLGSLKAYVQTRPSGVRKRRGHRLLAPNVADRQCRRRTWLEREARWWEVQATLILSGRGAAQVRRLLIFGSKSDA